MNQGRTHSIERASSGCRRSAWGPKAWYSPKTTSPAAMRISNFSTVGQAVQ
jgi:hypothetical protein